MPPKGIVEEGIVKAANIMCDFGLGLRPHMKYCPPNRSPDSLTSLSCLLHARNMSSKINFSRIVMGIEVEVSGIIDRDAF